jgi:hypothetical protein
LRERWAVPSLAAALRPTCASFDYSGILACTGHGVTPILSNHSQLRSLVARNHHDLSEEARVKQGKHSAARKARALHDLGLQSGKHSAACRRLDLFLYDQAFT